MRAPLSQTDNGTDLAINGDGFFTVKDDSDRTFYTRNGSFLLDDEGVLINQSDMKVQGFAFNPDTGDFEEELSNLQVEFTQLSKQTTEFSVSGLRLNFDTGQSPAVDLDVYGDIVDRITGLGINFQINEGTANGDTSWRVILSPGEGAVSNLNVPTSTDATLDEGEAAFDFFFTDGALTGVGEAGNVEDVTFDLTVDDQVYNLTWSLLDPNDPTSFATNEIISSTLPPLLEELNQDGYGTGELQEITVGQDGTVYTLYDNDNPNLSSVGRVAVTTFVSNDGLEKAGDTLFRSTPAAGEATVGTADSGRRGSILQFSLEASNVNLANELVHLIVTQTGFNANSTVVSTSNEMLQTAIQLKS